MAVATIVIVPCQEPCCREKRGEAPYPDSPEDVGRRVGERIIDDIIKGMTEDERRVERKTYQN